MSVQLILGEDRVIDDSFVAPSAGRFWSQYNATSDVSIPSNKLTIQGHILQNVDDKLNLSGSSGVLSATQLESDITITSQLSVDNLVSATSGSGGTIAVDGNLSTVNLISTGVVDGDLAVGKLTSKVYGDPVAGQILTVDSNLDVKWTDQDGDLEWSKADALQNVNMANYGLENLATLTLKDGSTATENQVLSVDGSGNLYWKNDSSADVSQWATYTASQNVNMGNRDITNVHDLTGASSIGSNVAYFNKISPITYGQGTSGQYLSLDQNLQIKWNTLPTSTPSTWANYPAVASVNMSGLDITNMGSLICNGTLQANQATPTSGTFTINGVGKAGNFENIYSGNENKLYILKSDTIRPITNGNGTANQLLSQDAQNKLKWVDAPTFTPSDWANYPASNNVDVDGNSLTNVNAIENDGADITMRDNLVMDNGKNLTVSSTGTLQSTNNTLGKITTLADSGVGSENEILSQDASGNLVWRAENTSADWSNFDATQNVNMNNYILNSLYNIHTIGGSEGTVSQILTVDADNKLTWEDRANVVPNWATVQASQTVDVNNNDLDNVKTITATDCATSNLNVYSFGSGSACNITADLSVYDDVGGLMTYWDRATNTITSETTANFTGFGNISSTTTTSNYFVQNSRFNKTVYVCPNTNTASDIDGTINNPFNSISSAMMYINDNQAGEYWSVILHDGTYTGAFNIQYPKLTIKGMTENIYGAKSSVINGNVMISVSNTWTDLHANQISLENLMITDNECISNSGLGNYCVNLRNCYLYASNKFYTDANLSGSATSRVRLIDCYLLQSSTLPLTDPMFEMKQGMLAMTTTQFENNASASSLLSLSGSAVVDVIERCKFSNSSSDYSVALVDITATASGSYSFQSCGFVFSNASSKPTTATAINSHPASGVNNVFVSYCSFFLQGLVGSGSYVVLSSNSLVFYFSNNALLNTTSSIEGTLGTSKFSLLAVS